MTLADKVRRLVREMRPLSRCSLEEVAQQRRSPRRRTGILRAAKERFRHSWIVGPTAAREGVDYATNPADPRPE